MRTRTALASQHSESDERQREVIEALAHNAGMQRADDDQMEMNIPAATRPRA
jgi:hypothetical protein